MSRYAEAKPYALPTSLAELGGPTVGTVVLPRHIDWGPHYEYDLADAADVVLMYERVAAANDAGFDQPMFADALARVRRYTHRQFAAFGLDGHQAEAIGQRFAD